MHSARAMGTAMSRIAEAEIALMRSQVEAPMTRDRVATASILARYRLIVEQLLPASASGMDALHRAYLVHLGQRYREWARSPSEHNVVDLVVGFADLTGSTALVQQLDLAALDRALVGFEERTSDLIAAAGASVVKRLGDGVMFVATEAETACRLALDLVDAFAPPSAGPPVRVGLAAGSVAALRGDFFGPAVHLAARIVGGDSVRGAGLERDAHARAGDGRLRVRRGGSARARGVRRARGAVPARAEASAGARWRRGLVIGHVSHSTRSEIGAQENVVFGWNCSVCAPARGPDLAQFICVNARQRIGSHRGPAVANPPRASPRHGWF